MKTIGLRDYAQLHGISVNAARSRIMAGKCPGSEKIGREWRIPIEDPVEDLDDLIDHDLARIHAPLDRQKYRKEKAMADLKEIELAQRRKEMIPIGEIKMQWSKIARRVRENIMTIPGKMAAELACETDPHKVEIMLTKEIHQILSDLCDEVVDDD